MTAGYTEKLLRLPRTRWCMRPPADDGASLERRAQDRPFTFASFNNFAKLSDAALDLWAALLASLPDARRVMVTVPEGRTPTPVWTRWSHAHRPITSRLRAGWRTTRANWKRCAHGPDCTCWPRR